MRQAKTTKTLNREITLPTTYRVLTHSGFELESFATLTEAKRFADYTTKTFLVGTIVSPAA